jgi:hypothetical protein
MYVLPTVANPLIPTIACDGLMPIRFPLKSYIDFCHQFDRALADLEARYPGKPKVITLSQRNKLLKRRPK